MEMTHAYSICNGFALLIRYNDEEDVIEYRYSDETQIKTSPLSYDDEGEPSFTTEEGVNMYLSEFCQIKL